MPYYDTTRMYNTSVWPSERVEHYIRGVPPRVLEPVTLRAIRVHLGNFSGPPELGEPAQARTVRLFNPSLVAAPAGLCPRCAWAVAIRADALHQCDESSPLFSWKARRAATAAFFKNTAIAILDTRLSVVAWTWFISQPHKQVASWAGHPRGYVPVGSADGFAPPWNQQVYDGRLLNLDGEHIFITYNCVACKFSISMVHLTGQVTADGGLASLRAWASQRVGVPASWIQGRNQALFSVPHKGDPGHTILVQPWFGVVASLGSPDIRRRTVRCYGPLYGQWSIARKQAHRWNCGTSAWGMNVTIDSIRNIKGGYGHPSILHVGSLNGVAVAAQRSGAVPMPAAAAALARAVDGGTKVAGLHANGSRLSPTANLVRIPRDDGCVAYLGVGHLHRSEGELNRRKKAHDLLQLRRAVWRQRPGKRTGRGPRTAREELGRMPTSRRLHETATPRYSGRQVDRALAFKFGFQYTHFFYVLSARPPHRLLASSGEFCLSAKQDARDCESVQFASGIALAERVGSGSESTYIPVRDRNIGASVVSKGASRHLRVLISFGVNDCESKLAELHVTDVWKLLQPMHDIGDVCQ